MRATAARLRQLERSIDRSHPKPDSRGNWHLYRLFAISALADEPDLALVRREDADDDETFRDIQETLAWARGDCETAARLQAATLRVGPTTDELVESCGGDRRAAAEKMIRECLSPETVDRSIRARRTAVERARARVAGAEGAAAGAVLRNVG